MHLEVPGGGFPPFFGWSHSSHEDGDPHAEEKLVPWQLYTYEALQELGGYTHPLPDTRGTSSSGASSSGATTQRGQQEQAASSSRGAQEQGGAQATTTTSPQRNPPTRAGNQQQQQCPRAGRRTSNNDHRRDRRTATSTDPTTDTTTASQGQGPTSAGAPRSDKSGALQHSSKRRRERNKLAQRRQSRPAEPHEPRGSRPHRAVAEQGATSPSTDTPQQTTKPRQRAPAETGHHLTPYSRRGGPHAKAAGWRQSVHHPKHARSQSSSGQSQKMSPQDSRTDAGRRRNTPAGTTSPGSPATTGDQRRHTSGSRRSNEQQQPRNPPRPITTGLWGATTAKPPGNGGEPARDSLRHHSGTQRDGGRRPNRGRGTRPEADSAPHTGRQQTVPHSPQGEGLGRSPWRRKLYRAGQ